MYENRKYVIFDTSETGSIQFYKPATFDETGSLLTEATASEVMETTGSTLRLNISGSKTFVKYDRVPAQAEVLYEEGDRFIEIWNLVFMQYEQISKDSRENLPKPSIDTGMGLERISALLQNSNDNYATDIFTPLINKSVELTNSDNLSNSPSHRVIADHLREKFGFAKYDPSEDEFSAADINSDGVVDVLDIVILVNAILGD